jgi:hypothetical protein
MARFPTEPGQQQPPEEARGSERQNKGARPLIPIIIFAIVLVVAFVRGCDSGKDHSEHPLQHPTQSIAQVSAKDGGVTGLP